MHTDKELYSSLFLLTMPAFSAACSFMRCAEAASWYSESFTCDANSMERSMGKPMYYSVFLKE